jgi:hypothetical protein
MRSTYQLFEIFTTSGTLEVGDRQYSIVNLGTQFRIFKCPKTLDVAAGFVNTLHFCLDNIMGTLHEDLHVFLRTEVSVLGIPS